MVTSRGNQLRSHSLPSKCVPSSDRHYFVELICSINLKVKSKELVAVVGHVGAGKSSLVQALLGEMEKVSGTVTIKVRWTNLERRALNLMKEFRFSLEPRKLVACNL